MTRTSLLQLLAHPTALTGADVRALEELAQAFPYCQSAHLLLAKAAHDQGSMLAPQRLRRAATYAADRNRLRQLIEAPIETIAPVAAETLVADTTAATAQALTAPAPGLAAALPAVAESAIAEAPATDKQPVDFQESSVLEDKPDQVIGTPDITVASPPAAELPPAAEVPAAVEVPEIEVPAEELPAQPPPIRPPAEAENARFEFGLIAEEPAEIIAYRLPDLAEPGPPAPAARAATPWLPPFGGVADVSYAPGEGSRLGFCLLLTEEAGEAPTTTSLPPAGEFFAPDALLLEHLAAHQPVLPPKLSSLDLINSFLQRAPVASRRRAMPTPAMPDADPQADLSVRSTRAESDLVSENLAHILARQGKNERAIAVYERLMVKHPEKMAYFAAQIESLRPLA